MMSDKIKMRINTKMFEDTKCYVCGRSRKNVLDLVDIKIADLQVITICDECVDALFYKCLKAACYTNGRVKSQNDIRVKNARFGGTYKKVKQNGD